MTFLEVAYKILKKEKTPIHSKDITMLAIERGLLKTKGETPENTMDSILTTDSKKNKSRFKKIGKSIFILKTDYKKNKKISLFDKNISKNKEKNKKKKGNRELEVFREFNKKRYVATLINLGKVKLNGIIFKTPSAAAMSICDYNVNGWNFWKIEINGKIRDIDCLRKR